MLQLCRPRILGCLGGYLGLSEPILGHFGGASWDQELFGNPRPKLTVPCLRHFRKSWGLLWGQKLVLKTIRTPNSCTRSSCPHRDPQTFRPSGEYNKAVNDKNMGTLLSPMQPLMVIER